jgi:hypothetical protein
MGVSIYHTVYSIVTDILSELSEPKGNLVESSEPTPISTRTQPSLGTWISPRRTVTSGVLLGRSSTTLDGGFNSVYLGCGGVVIGRTEGLELSGHKDFKECGARTSGKCEKMKTWGRMRTGAHEQC